MVSDYGGACSSTSSAHCILNTLQLVLHFLAVYSIFFIELSQSTESMCMSDIVLSLPQHQERTEDRGQTWKMHRHVDGLVNM